MTSDLVRELHATFDRRPRPEQVATIAARLLAGRLADYERVVLGRAAIYAERWSLMSDDWERPVPAVRQVAFIAAAFDGIAKVPEVDPADPASLRALAAELGPAVGWTVDASTAARWGSGRGWQGAPPSGVSHRRRNRAWRALNAVAGKADRLERVIGRRACALASRAGLAGTITLDDVEGDVDAACLAAYLVARRNERRAFVLEGRDNPFDEVAEMLMARLGDGADWWTVARAWPSPEVLARLSPERRGEMVGAWWSTMRAAARLCADVDAESPIDRRGMVVRRGQDSDTWNLAAGAYNVARSSWVKALAAEGLLGALEATCPPKLPRLMAADLAYWHRQAGEAVHVDVRVAALLPPAWEVVDGRKPCTAADVAAACRRAGMTRDEVTRSGWLAPLPKSQLGTSGPTPELVHGIAVGDPILASMLRRAGAWSGGPIRWEHLPEELPGDVGGEGRGAL